MAMKFAVVAAFWVTAMSESASLPGGVTAAEIEVATGIAVERSGDGKIVAPGMLASHYAPEAAIRLDARRVEPGEALLKSADPAIELVQASQAIARCAGSGRGPRRRSGCGIMRILRRLAPGRLG